MRKHVLLFMAIVLLTPAATAQDSPLRWFKGNLHSHTINSDGDSPPFEVMAWYKRHGYQFLALTDHDTFTDPKPMDSNPTDNFVLIGAEEITNEKAVHVNAIGISSVIPRQSGSTVTEILKASIDAVRAQKAVPLVNHPNFLWAFTATEMLPLKGPFLLEIASGHPIVNHAGDGRIPSTEQMWDQLLSAGISVFAAAVDDSHDFREEFGPARANPGRAWIAVRAAALSRESVLDALTRGDFYASTGVNLKEIQATESSLSVEIRTPANDSRRYRVVFVGTEGRVLSVSYDNPARYEFQGTEGYVRARIEESNGLRAWTQPVFVKTK